MRKCTEMDLYNFLGFGEDDDLVFVDLAVIQKHFDEEGLTLEWTPPEESGSPFAFCLSAYETVWSNPLYPKRVEVYPHEVRRRLGLPKYVEHPKRGERYPGHELTVNECKDAATLESFKKMHDPLSFGFTNRQPGKTQEAIRLDIMSRLSTLLVTMTCMNAPAKALAEVIDYSKVVIRSDNVEMLKTPRSIEILFDIYPEED